MSPVKTLDELRIDTDILIIGIDNLSQSEDKLEAIEHLEESIKYLKDGIKRCQADNANVCSSPTATEEEKRYSSSEDDINFRIDITEVKQPDNQSLALPLHDYSQTQVLNKSAQAIIFPPMGEVNMNTINCPYCSFSTQSVHTLRSHMSRHTSQIKCEICDAYFA